MATDLFQNERKNDITDSIGKNFVIKWITYRKFEREITLKRAYLNN